MLIMVSRPSARLLGQIHFHQLKDIKINSLFINVSTLLSSG